MNKFPPDSGTYGSHCYRVLDDDDREFFMKDKTIKKLIRQNKVGIEMYEVWIFDEDTETRDILDDIFGSY